MPRYQYKAINQSRQPVSGDLEADSLHSAQEQLTQEGLAEITLQMVNAADQLSREKSDDEAANVVFSDENVEELGEAFASLTRAGLPLEAGLRMMAEEHPSPHISRALLSLSQQLEAGKTWEEISASSSQQFPPVLSELFQLKLPPQSFSELLSRYFAITQSAFQTHRKIWSGLLYSQVILLSIVFAMGFIMIGIVPKFKAIFLGFDTELPEITVTVITLADFLARYGRWFVYLLISLLIVRLFGARFVKRLTQQLVYRLPFTGQAFQNTSLSTFCRLFAELIERQVPLDVAVKVAASGSGNLQLEDESLQIAAKLKQGNILTEAARSCLAIPKPLLLTFRWSNQPKEFQESLRANGESYAVQAENGAHLLPVVLEPFLLFITTFTVGFIVTALFLPLIKLLNDLS